MKREDDPGNEERARPMDASGKRFGQLLGETFACSCGRTHVIEPREAIYADEALSLLPEILARHALGRRAAVLLDERTRAAAGEEALAALKAAHWRSVEVLVADPAPGHSPVCDDLTLEALQARIGEVDLFLPVGSGVLCDLGKWLAWERKLPFVALATAASMNGYASANIAPTLKGVKSLLYARPPGAVVSAPRILEAAPHELTSAGLGDILAKSVSTADWRLNHLLFGDHYCPRAAGLINDIEPLYLDRPAAIRRREREALAALFEGLLYTGVAMTMAGTSAPSSGGEHMVSHTLDMMASVDGREHDLHGRQVGVGTVLTSELYRRVLALERPAWAAPAPEVDRGFWGTLAGAVAGEYGQKLERIARAQEALARPGAWDRLRAELALLVRTPERIRECLKTAGAASRAEEIRCTRARLEEALAHAHEIRSRFTVLDLARLAGILPKATGEIVEAWA
ncbi:MAG: iron-containing alcohol dehydrogenase [Planctomycetota bacterium]